MPRAGIGAIRDGQPYPAIRLFYHDRTLTVVRAKMAPAGEPVDQAAFDVVVDFDKGRYTVRAPTRPAEQ
ncbi:MAG: hypothetical protein HYS04_01835 [Acidobacteria bacterium]|nr:hypothetical protein [Acidobacteriota bacterium]